jgi:hypothetical protein
MPLNIIGAGFGRTGTMSLKLAIEELGLGPCYHMSEVISNRERVADWLDAANGRPDWERVFAGYSATVDHPGCHFWRELAAAYPKAKVVLTVRDPVAWFESTQATVFSPRMRGLVAESPMKEFLWRTVWGDFGAGIDDRDQMVAAFEAHVARVKDEISGDRLLVFDVAEGWQPLCEFLDVAVPKTPFPRSNSREEMAAILGAASAGGEMSLDDMQARHRERAERLDPARRR